MQKIRKTNEPFLRKRPNWQTDILTQADRQRWFYRTFVEGGSNKAVDDIFGLSLAYDNYGEHLNFLIDQFGNKQSIISSSNIKILIFESVIKQNDSKQDQFTTL